MTLNQYLQALEEEPGPNAAPVDVSVQPVYIQLPPQASAPIAASQVKTPEALQRVASPAVSAPQAASACTELGT